MRAIFMAALFITVSVVSADGDVLVVKTIGGLTSVQGGLSSHDCTSARDILLAPQRAYDEMVTKQRESAPQCPDEKDKKGWDKVQTYGGCRYKNGGGGMSWGLGMSTTNNSDISTAECVK